MAEQNDNEFNDEFEDDFEDEFDENRHDPTKDAFFSDLLGMEEEIASEAYELVEHALKLIESKYFEDSVEVLRQAIGLYTQINREEEIEAVTDKIAEVYLLKEKAFRETEIEVEREIVESKEERVPRRATVYDLEPDPILEEVDVEPVIKAGLYINEGQQLMDSTRFQEALDKFDMAVTIFEEANYSEGIERVFQLIEECYKKKAEFLRSVKKDKRPSETKIEPVKGKISVKEAPEDKKLQEYLISKKREEEISTQAYERLGNAAELAKAKHYEQALELYKESAALFKELNWPYEVEKVQNTILEIEKEKAAQLEGIEKEKIEQKEEIGTQKVQVEKIDQQIQQQEEQEKAARLERLKESELQRMELEFFKAQIDNMATEALNMAHNYERAMQKSIRERKMIGECVYPKVIEMYKKIKDLLIDKGWRSEAAIYDDTIDVYIQKFEKDKKIREIEAEKAKKQKEIAALSEAQKEEPIIEEEEVGLIDEQKKREEQLEEFDQNINDMVKRAEQLAREYDLRMKKAVRQGKLAEDPPFEEIIETYKKARELVFAKGREMETATYDNQISLYFQKWERDKKLREIESKKLQKQKDLEEMHKVGVPVGKEEEKLRLLEKKKAEEDFESYLTKMVDQAEKMVRDHETEKRKALKKGEILESTPYLEVIEIYNKLRKQVYARGWKNQAEAYANQVKLYQEKLEKHQNLLEVEAQKAQKQKDIDEMYRVERKPEIDEERLKIIDKKREEEDFEKYLTEMVNNAERMVRNHELEMRKALRKGDILESTPYSEVIEIYKQIRKKVYARGWKNQAEAYANQIKIYQEKLDKHERLLEVEEQKAHRERNLDEMHRIDKAIELDQRKLQMLEKKKEEQEFQKNILDMVNKAEKLEREYDIAMKKAIKKGKIIEQTPYPKIIEIYKQIKDKLVERGWIDQVELYSNQIKIYQDKLLKSEKLREVEAKKVEKQKELEEMHKVKKEFKPAKPDRVKESETEAKEEDILSDKAMNLIDEAERLVKNYEVSRKTDVLLYDSPYEKAIEFYKKAKAIFKQIGWNDEVSHLINTIKFYEDTKERDDKLREIEKKKLEEPELKLKSAKVDAEKELFAREQRILELQKKEKEKVTKAEPIFEEIHKAEKMAKEYDLKIKDGIFEYKAPYDEIINIYRQARKEFEKIDWMEESMKLITTIRFYKEKSEKDKKLRALESEKTRKREEELLTRKTMLEQARKEQERYIKQKKESLLIKEEKESEFQSAQDKAFRLMDRAKSELKQNHFEKAIQLYTESEEIFAEISWQEGINMVRDSISMIKRKQIAYEQSQAAIEQKEAKRLKIEEKLEEKFAKADELRKLQQEEKRKQFMKVQLEKQREREISEEAYQLLEQGTSLLNAKKFEEAHEKYIEARELFNTISWKREVSRINNELLFKLNRERKSYEILEDLKVKKTEEVKLMEKLREEAKREQLESEKRKKEEKRKLAKEEVDKKIIRRIESAEKLIEDLKFNEGILLLKKEKEKLDESEKGDIIKRIEDKIKEVKDQSQVPLITLEPLENSKNFDKFKAAYMALDGAQISLKKKFYMRAISEFREARAVLNELKMDEKITREIDDIIEKLQEKLGRKPGKDEKIAKLTEDEKIELTRARVAQKREERKQKVLELLKKGKE